ncbi:MAG: hypothetical protein PHD57_00675 [Desulfobacterales bacterium]|nr:hypothetical protein [Desulfobacterales bacterium]
MKENLQAARALEEGSAGVKARDAAAWAAAGLPVRAATASARNAAIKNRMNAAFPALSVHARNVGPEW